MTKYRDILGVSDTANKDDFKTAYRKLAQKYHPDRNPDNPEAEEKFKAMKEAYEGLNEGYETKEARDRVKNPRVRPSHQPDVEEILRHFHSQFSGFHPGGTPSFRSTMNELAVPVDVMFTGGTIKFVTMSKMVHQGGAVFHPVQQSVTVPPNSKVGQKIDFTVGGQKQTGVLIPESSEEYTVDGLDIGISHPIDVLDLIVGSKIKIIHPNGKRLKVTVKPISNRDGLMRLKGKGLEDTYGMYGDFFIQLMPLVPTLDEEQRKILEEALKKIRK